jgi:hypothetical protein
MGIHSLPVRRTSRIVLVGLLGLTLALVAVTAGHARAGQPGHAVAAKKCKKKHKHSASSAKKKKCKKVHRVVLPPPGPLLRATLSWTVGNEVDLHAFDANGNHAGWDFGIDGVVNNIPSAHHGGDSGGAAGGSETFTDDIFVLGGPSNREFTYVACLYPEPSDSYTATFTAVSKNGTGDTKSVSGPGIWVLGFPGGPAISDLTAANTC